MTNPTAQLLTIDVRAGLPSLTIFASSRGIKVPDFLTRRIVQLLGDALPPRRVTVWLAPEFVRTLSLYGNMINAFDDSLMTGKSNALMIADAIRAAL